MAWSCDDANTLFLSQQGLPIDIARVVCFLASNDGGWV